MDVRLEVVGQGSDDAAGERVAEHLHVHRRVTVRLGCRCGIP